jgi:hypothetical protein
MGVSGNGDDGRVRHEEENMMRRFILAGLALSATLVAPQQASSEAQWCRTGRAEGGHQCMYYTFEQCAAATERLNGGGCIENPNYHGSSTPAAIRGVRAIQHHAPRQRRHDDANR